MLKNVRIRVFLRFSIDLFPNFFITTLECRSRPRGQHVQQLFQERPSVNQNTALYSQQDLFLYSDPYQVYSSQMLNSCRYNIHTHLHNILSVCAFLSKCLTDFLYESSLRNVQLNLLIQCNFVTVFTHVGQIVNIRPNNVLQFK